jgi:hypothetical protein
MLRVLANREQSKDNFVKIADSQTGCCGSKKTECLYSYAEAAGNRQIDSITIDGEEFKLQDGTPEGQAIYAIYNALPSSDATEQAAKAKYTRQVVLPYLFKSAGLLEVDQSVVISADGQTITIESEIAITLDDRTPTTTECIRQAYCDYCISNDSVSGAFDIVVEGTTYTITPATDFDYPTGRADLEAKIIAALTDAEEVVVLDDTANSAYTIVITYPTDISITFAGASMPCCNVEIGWKSA